MSFPTNLGSVGPSPQEVQSNPVIQPKKVGFGLAKKNASVFERIHAPAADSQTKEITAAVKLLDEKSENTKFFEDSKVIETIAENTHVFDYNKLDTENIEYRPLKTSEENPNFNSPPKNNVDLTLNKVNEASEKIIITKNLITHSKPEEKTVSAKELNNKDKLSKADSKNFDMLTDEIESGKVVYILLHPNNTFELGSSNNYDAIVASNGIFASKDKKEKIKNLDKYEALGNPETALNKELKKHLNNNTVFILSTKQSEKINLLIQQLNQKEKKEVVNLTRKNDLNFEKIIVQIFKQFKSDEVILNSKSVIILTKLFKAFSKTDAQKDEEAIIKKDIQKRRDKKVEEDIELKKDTAEKIDQNVQQNNKPKK